MPGNKQFLSMDQLVDVMVLDVTVLYSVLSLGAHRQQYARLISTV